MRRPLLFLLAAWAALELIMTAFGMRLAGSSAAERTMAGRSAVYGTAAGQVKQVSPAASGETVRLSGATITAAGRSCRVRGVLVYTDEADSWKIGWRISVHGEIRQWEEPGNPGQFNLRSHYQAQGIDLFVMPDSSAVLERKTDRLGESLRRIREVLSAQLGRLAPAEDAGVLAAVLLGDRSGLSEDTRREFQAGGISHIIAVSGLHISLTGMLLYRILRRLGAGSIPGAAVAGSLASCYVVMTGGSPTSLRALLMFLLYLGGQVSGRTYDALSGLGTAGLILLLLHPALAGEYGFQLSVLAVIAAAGIRPEVERWLGIRRVAAKNVLFAVVIQIVTMPVIAAMNGVIPVYSLLVNLLALPFAGVMLGSAAVGALTGLAGSCAGGVLAGQSVLREASDGILPWVLDHTARLMLIPGRLVLLWIRVLCRLTARLPGHSYVTGAPKLWQIVLYGGILASFWLAVRRQNRLETGKPVRLRTRRIAGAVLAAAALVLSLHHLPERGLQMTFLDVGQGDCTFVRNENHCLLVDGGSSSEKEVGEYRILPFLMNQGVRRLDAVIVTHGDADHLNGLAEVLSAGDLKVDAICFSPAAAEASGRKELEKAAREGGVSVRILRAGDKWTFGDMKFRCIYPEQNEADQFAEEDRNDTSLVIRADYGDFSALLTGDLGTGGEEKILARENLQPVTVLKAGHHGSRGSSSDAFLGKLCPQIAVISCGNGNRYGHPHRETLERLAKAGSAVLRTDRSGAVTVRVQDGKREYLVYRR